MKKVAVFAVVTALAGCASDSGNMQIVSSSSEEVYTAEQLRSIERMQEAKVKQETVALKEVAVASIPVKQTVAPVEKKHVTLKQEVKKQEVYKPKPKKTVYKKPVAESEGYTIQVLALSHNKGFRPYMNKLPSNQPVWVNKKELQGVPWYTMLFGHYRTREEAKHALDALPQDVKDYGPFIRSLHEIKSSTTPNLTKLN